jgi:PhoPQ-activated pathogenicity-related protein
MACVIAIASLRIGRADEPPVPTALQEYVAKPESSYAVERVGEQKSTPQGTMDRFTLTSQTWQGIVWKHGLFLYSPKKTVVPNHCILFITGGKTGGGAGDKDHAKWFKLAELAGGPVAALYAVPNQPLFENRVEDDLITDTFLKYLDTKDANWPLLFPMVKSAVKALDAVQSIAEKDWKRPIKTFVVTGASKRGWTTWLSAAADKRIIGIAPIVIDALNFRPQMKYQMATWGAYSEQIHDYSSKGLIDVMEQKPDIPLWRWVDPYTYRKQLTLPKLIVNGTNDPYWVVDALNNYWDGLVGPKHVFYVPNAGHGLDGGQDRALGTIAVFSRRTVQGKTLPKMDWTFENTSEGRRLSICSDAAPSKASVWVAHSDTKDFRKSKWVETPMISANDKFTAEVHKPSSGHQAIHATLTFMEDDAPYSLSTQIKWE